MESATRYPMLSAIFREIDAEGRSRTINEELEEEHALSTPVKPHPTPRRVTP